MRCSCVSLALGLLLLGGGVSGGSAQELAPVPWWKQGKINFMWGAWGIWSRDFAHPQAVDDWKGRAISPEVFRNAALAGGTVWADWHKYDPANARQAQAQGMKYFSSVPLHHLTWKPGGRTWVNREGEEVEKFPGQTGQLHRCPLDESLYERWLADTWVQEGILEGLVDGILVDWESTEAGICYCDFCFAQFLEIEGLEAELPPPAERFAFVEARGLEQAYGDNFHQQRFGMFTRIRQRLQALHPQLLFASYGTLITDFTRAMHTPQAPFVFLDSRHYCNDDRQPWWESYCERVRQEGYLYIAGGWTNALFGAQPSQVSAARWIYEAMVNGDGVWVFFAHKLTDQVLSAFATADGRVRAVEGVVGDFLLQGQGDPNFTTVVEWSGNPQLEQAARHRTYHLGDRHLVHVNNVDADWPLRVRLRFPRLAEGVWTVSDPLGNAYYTSDGRTVRWTTEELRAGVVVSLDTRSDAFVLLAPATDTEPPAGARLVFSREFDALFSHQEAAAEAAAQRAPVHTLPRYGWSFRMDLEDRGRTEQWFLPGASLAEWEPMEIEKHWGEQGRIGPHWYRRDVEIPALPEQQRLYLHFGAVDEELRLWIDGEYVGEYNRGGAGWDQPFALEVTGKLSEGPRHFAMRVRNTEGGGGVWKPVSLLAVDPAAAPADGGLLYGERLAALLERAQRVVFPPQTGPQGRLAYTATEQLLQYEPLAQWTPNDGQRCFVNNALRTVATDGEDDQRLRHLHGDLWSPSYSPDGSRIMFVHDAGGRGQVYVMNADGAEAVNLSDNEYCDRSPVWSPEGNRIAFVSDRTGDWDIWVMNADGSGQQRLAGNPGLDRAPAWSPDGQMLAWESHVSGMPNLWLVDADGQNSRPLIAPDRPLRVEHVEGARDAVFDFTDSARPFADNTFYLTDPVWSPDGQQIAAPGLGGYSGHMVAVIAADGSRLLQVVRWIGGVDDVCWSPDGTMLAASYRTAPQETERTGVLVIKADGSDANPFGKLLVDVVPQGPRLGQAHRHGVPTWYAHGSAQPRRVLKTFTSLAWSPDGTTLAFTSDMDPSGAFYVYTVPVEGGEPTRLDATQSAWPNEVCWRP